MGNILLFREVSISLLLDSLLFLMLSVAFYQVLVLLKNYKKGATSKEQYKLEKNSYLIITIISVSIVFKILLLPFYIHTLDALSDIVPGAMCAAGVVKANDFGNYALIVKIVVPFVSMLWLTLNSRDEKIKEQPYFKTKLYFFVAIYLVVVVELALEFLFFSSISTLSPVLCCSSIYTQSTTNPLPFHLNDISLLFLFYALYISLLALSYLKKRLALFFVSIFYIYISYYAIVYFFGMYIYQLPTHKCPFCMFESDYNYIGYLIYSSLFLASFYAISSSVYSFDDRSYKLSALFYTLFVLSVSYPFVSYLFTNHTFIV